MLRLIRFRTDFLAHLKTNESGLLDTINKEGALSKEVEAKLKGVVSTFVKSFL